MTDPTPGVWAMAAGVILAAIILAIYLSTLTP